MLEYRTTELSGESKAEKQTSTTQSEQIQQRETVLYSEIRALPVCGPDYGLSGYYIIPEIGAYKAAIRWSEIQGALLPSDLSVPNVVRRPSEHQYLVAWSKADYHRLRIDSKVVQIKGPEIEASQAQGLLGKINR